MRPSEIIDSRYRLERLLGTGGMAEVWLAEDQRLGRWVALKILREETAAQEGELISSFRREARVIARLQHPNIVQVYDAGVHEGRNYLVMEYVHGYSLRALLQAQPRLEEAEAVGYATQLAAALQYAHDQGVVHCDVKPENVLVSENHVPKLADFGVAETLTRTLAPEEARAVLGTIGYLAPEVIQGEQADARSDVYSLALTLYEMLAGRLPWAGANAAAVAGQRLATPAPPVRAFNRAVSPELEAVLARALSIGQESRFQSAGEFASALRRASSERRPPGSAASVAVAGASAAGSVVSRAARPPVGTTPARHRSPQAVRATRARRSGSGGGVVVGVMVAVLLAAAAGIGGAFVISRGGDSAPTPAPTATRPAVIASTPTSTPSPTPRPTNEPTITPTPSATATPTKAATPPTATPTIRPSTTPSPPPGSATPGSPTVGPGGLTLPGTGGSIPGQP